MFFNVVRSGILMMVPIPTHFGLRPFVSATNFFLSCSATRSDWIILFHVTRAENVAMMDGEYYTPDPDRFEMW